MELAGFLSFVGGLVSLAAILTGVEMKPKKSPRHFNEVFWPIARKSHRCIWCYERIDIHEKHAHYVGVWEGEFQDWRMHEECLNDYDTNYDSEDGFMPGSQQRPERANCPMTARL